MLIPEQRERMIEDIRDAIYGEDNLMVLKDKLTEYITVTMMSHMSDKELLVVYLRETGKEN